MLEPAFSPVRLRSHNTFLRLLKVSLVLGVGCDLLLAAVLWLQPALLSRWLVLPLSVEGLPAQLMALLLTAMAGVYLLAAYDPVAYNGNILVAIFGRFGGAVILGLAAWQHGGSAGLLWMAGAEAVLGILHAVAWLPSRRWR